MESLMRYLNISPNISKLPGIDIKSLLLNKLKTLYTRKRSNDSHDYDKEREKK
jgi:hypothetical protein